MSWRRPRAGKDDAARKKVKNRISSSQGKRQTVLTVAGKKNEDFLEGKPE